MLINSIMGETAQLVQTSDAVGTWLQPQGLTLRQREPLKFNAVVKHSRLRVAEGITVPVELDLFGQSFIKLGGQSYPLQLRIGGCI